MPIQCCTKLFVLCLTVLFTGCGGGPDDAPDLAPVSGTVKLDGQPLADVVVTFIPESGPAATGKTDTQGNFTLSTKGSNDGAVIGNHKVAVTPATSADIPPAGADPNESLTGTTKIPAKYADANGSGLTAIVAAGNENNVPLKLSSK